MDETGFENLTLATTEGHSRRDLARLVAGMALGGSGALSTVPETPARKRKKRRSRRKQRWHNQATFGSEGSGASEFDRPVGVAVSSDGKTTFVADAANNRVSIWQRSSHTGADWANQTIFGSPGGGASEFDGPVGVAVSHDDLTVFVADSGNHRISVWTRSSATGTDWTNQTTFGEEGEESDELSGVAAVDISHDGLTAFVADSINNRVSVWKRDSASSTDWTHQTNFGNYGRGTSEFDAVFDIAVSSDGKTVFAADNYNDRISVWRRSSGGSTDWTHHANFGREGHDTNEFDAPLGVAISSDSKTAFVADASNHRVSIWRRSRARSRDWTHQVNFGKGGSGLNEFGWLSDVFISIDGLTAFVADPDNSRISVWIRS